ncbi:hypothetical protein NCS57_00939500 [Fusarium keratoplasticum]|uniref:Uncharacterized protein n=1 Tax=Fusarium keratoplasticum TaxID=1328300 RepID=A0ACC0QTC1_9HYPO|nr:hypothetical protein NCS57_00939500 [Fusarium keratoplasticum]KAI8663387.1 hypothetical protein NCS57_00939500 [Fusarium keratoplasticum]KAI8664075.1 hypothetical protein NCS55_00914500 [Fusarium keratoplasticum]
MSSIEEQARQRLIQQAQQRQLQLMAARQQQQRQAANQTGQQMGMAMGSSNAPTGLSMATAHDDIPITSPSDFDLFNGRATSHPDFVSFQAACRDGPLSVVESIVTSEPHSPAFLHQGLIIALGAGNIDAARYLLGYGAPVTRQTPPHVLSAPKDRQIALFELLTQHGWTPNTPGFYGATLLPRVVTDDSLVEWFLTHGADPNLGVQRDNRDRFGGPETDSCAALEIASSRGSVESVRKLLDAGARMENGSPMYFAAGACPPNTNPHASPVTPSKDFDEARIPIMALLIEKGADVNGKLQSRHMTAQYPIVNAVLAGAVERVRWLLSQGADPNLRGAYGSAVEYARKAGSDEMKLVLGVDSVET